MINDAESKKNQIKTKWNLQRNFLNERQRRLWAGVEALVLGRGGMTLVCEATGLSQLTVKKGREEAIAIKQGRKPKVVPEQQRRTGGGRPRAEEQDKELKPLLMSLVEPTTRGEPESPLRWTTKSTAKLSAELCESGHFVSAVTVARILHEEGFSLQALSKTEEGGHHPDRNQQFEYINEMTKEYQDSGNPVISIDTKKKELVGSFKNGGQEWQPKGSPEKVNVYDFPTLAEGKAVPYGVYDILNNEGWVSVGISADTAAFATNTIRSWWYQMGQQAYPKANRLLLTADSGGSNSARSRLFKSELQNFANEIGLEIQLMHFPPGTSKWNKIEHRMFNHISMNWRGRPLSSYEIVVNCIANTKTNEGLQINAALDLNIYQTGLKISDERMNEINLQRDPFHGEWNYKISPSCRSK